MTVKGGAFTAAATTPAPASPATDVRFAPGAIISGRYRLIALLGKGGMGEVYRADDLILDQPVALKFLPPGADDEAKLGQLHNELRIARQVSHKNVCRLYDLGEAGGHRSRWNTSTVKRSPRCSGASDGCRTTRPSRSAVSCARPSPLRTSAA